MSDVPPWDLLGFLRKVDICQHLTYENPWESPRLFNVFPMEQAALSDAKMLWWPGGRFALLRGLWVDLWSSRRCSEIRCFAFLVGALEHQFLCQKNLGKNDDIPIWLVLWNINFIFPEILGISSSQLTNIFFFSEGWPNHQPDMLVERHPILLRPWCYLMLDVDDLSCAFIRICNHWAWESHKPSAQLGQRCCLNIWYLLIEVHDVHGLSSSFLLDDLDDLDGYLMVIVLPVYTIWRHSHME